MDEDARILVIGITSVVVSVLIFIFLFSYGAYKYNVEIAESNMIVVYQDNIKIYEGKQAFIDVNSGGMTTTVIIHKKLFPFEIVDKTYSSPNIRIEPKGK